MSDIDERSEEIKEDVNSILSNVELEDIKTNGITIRSGDKLIKFSLSGEEGISSIEDDVREEMREKVSEKMNNVRQKVIEKLSEMSSYVTTVKNELEAKKSEYKRKIRSANLMPEITTDHAKQGLSVVKDTESGKDSFLWLFQAVYWPKYIDGKVIKPSYSKRLINNILIGVYTTGDKVRTVDVLQPFGLRGFDHYHQNCWGNWTFPKSWETPDDIVAIAKQAEVVLETVNTGSIANRSPRGLMRVSTLVKHSTVPKEEEELDFSATKRAEGMGLNDNYTRENVWST